jgi:hypothetical protein
MEGLRSRSSDQHERRPRSAQAVDHQRKPCRYHLLQHLYTDNPFYDVLPQKRWSTSLGMYVTSLLPHLFLRLLTCLLDLMTHNLSYFNPCRPTSLSKPTRAPLLSQLTRTSSVPDSPRSNHTTTLDTEQTVELKRQDVDMLFLLGSFHLVKERKIPLNANVISHRFGRERGASFSFLLSSSFFLSVPLSFSSWVSSSLLSPL